ncbi:heme chaperone HemW-like [Juglans regia]|uniref:Heme chaperone HemW-like n=1 Tax=Juglans regia TaxID=51240 RepID=A0A6P9EAB6_JUGRE|nr:heme chaperone HemW-like [Juglans regia]
MTCYPRKQPILPQFSVLHGYPTQKEIENGKTKANANLQSVAVACSRCEISIRMNIALPPTSAYIHLPFCRKRCHYCDFPIVALDSSSNQTDDDPRALNYIQLLCQEINATRIEFETNPSLEKVFFKGGTPLLVPPRLVASVLKVLGMKFGLSSNVEISMEMDLETFDSKKEELIGLGVNRVPLGVQAFQEELLKVCGRAHGLNEVYEAIEIVGSCGVENSRVMSSSVVVASSSTMAGTSSLSSTLRYGAALFDAGMRMRRGRVKKGKACELQIGRGFQLQMGF